MFRCLGLIFIPALALACCPPNKWEATQYISIDSRSMDGSMHKTLGVQNITVDSALRRIYISSALRADSHDVVQHILQDFSSGEQYVTDVMTGKCEITPVDSIEPGCVPDNTTKVFQSYVGGGKHKVMATMYKLMFGHNNIRVTMADDGCIPMFYEATGPLANGGSYELSMEIVDVTAGVADTSYFATPRMCHKSGPVFTGVGK